MNKSQEKIVRHHFKFVESAQRNLCNGIHMRYLVESQIEKNTKLRQNAYSESQTREAEAERNENYPYKHPQACQNFSKAIFPQVSINPKE